jgi:hypothetical protein
MRFSDTTPEAEALQLELLRGMTGEQRVMVAWDMSLFGRELFETRIRTAHPDWMEAQIRREWLRIAFLPHPLPPGLP